MYRLKPNVLTLFLLRRFFASFFLVTLTVCGVIFTVTFVERLSANPDTISTLMDTWIRLLAYFPMFLPLAVFMGTLVAFYNLTKSSELIIISGTGLSPFQIAKPFVIGAILIGVFASTVVNPYSVRLTTSNLTDNQLKLIDNAVWLRESSNDGFLIAREDLKLRGPGDMFGVRQSGEFSFKVADIYQDADELEMASNDVDEIIKADPDLGNHPKLRSTLNSFLTDQFYVL